MKVGTRKLSLVGLRTFCTVARCGSFRLAAEELFVTASAVSHRIKALEEELGSRLIERHDRSLSLTDTGQIFFEEVSPLLEEIDDSANRVRYREDRSFLRISAQPFFASELLVPALETFTATHPLVDITVDTSEDINDKHPPNTDISLRLCRRPPDQFNHDRIFSLYYVPACSPEFRERCFDGDGIALAPFPVIVHARKANVWDNWAAACGEEAPTASSIIKLDSMISVARAAEEGLGAALIPMPVSRRWFDSGALVRLYEQDLYTRDSYYIIYRGEPKSAARTFHQWVLQKFAHEA